MKNDIVTKCAQIDNLKQQLQDALRERSKNDFVVNRTNDQGMCFLFGRRTKNLHKPWRCDRCDPSGKFTRSSSVRFGCDECDFDLCQKCYSKCVDDVIRQPLL